MYISSCSETFPSGCLTLDFALGGGLPKGRIVEVFVYTYLHALNSYDLLVMNKMDYYSKCMSAPCHAAYLIIRILDALEFLPYYGS